MKAAAYVRVSSASQNAAMQREAITRAAKQRGDRIVEWYEDKESGKSLMRPSLDRVRMLARGGEISKLYVWKLDRITRSGILDTLSFVREMREVGCLLVCLADPLHFEGPTGDLFIAMLAFASQIELAAQKERRFAARERVRSEGGKWGRPKRTTPAQEERVAAMLEKKSVRAVSVALKIPRATVGRIASRLKSPPRNVPAESLEKPTKQKTVPPPSH